MELVHDLDDLDDTTSDTGAETGTVDGGGTDLDDLDDTAVTATGDGVIDSGDEF